MHAESVILEEHARPFLKGFGEAQEAPVSHTLLQYERRQTAGPAGPVWVVSAGQGGALTDTV